MYKKLRFLICALFFSVFLFAVAAACTGGDEKDKEGEENGNTITFVSNTEESVDAITAVEGEDISDRLPDFKDTAAYYFGGWYTAKDFSGEPVVLPKKMPAEDTTYYAKWYVTYSIEKYLQKSDLSGYETESAESLSGEVNKGDALPARVKNFLESDPTGFVLHSDGNAGASRVLTLSERDNTLKMYYDRDEFLVIYKKNSPVGEDGAGDMVSESAVYGVEHTLSANPFVADGYRFAGWSLDPMGEELIDSINVTNTVYVYAIWDKALSDIFGGSDRIYLPRNEAGVVYLERAELGEKKGTYTTASSFFKFDQGEEGLTGKILDEYFFYFKDVWQHVFTNEDEATLELKADGSAVLVEGGQTVEGSYSIDMASGYFVFESNGVDRLFVLKADGDTLTFSFSGSEQGWYALQTEDGFGYDLLFLDGFGRMSIYAVSPESPDFDPFFDVYSGRYELEDEEVYVAHYAWGLYTSTFPFKLTLVADKELDGVKLKGTYIFGDYRGTFTDIDYEYNTLVLDGFGHGSYGGYYRTEGTYTLEEESWAVDNYPTPGTYTETIVVFTSEYGTVTRFAIFGDYYLEVSADFYGRYEFEVVPESIYPGSRGDVAFMYFSGYTIYADGSFNDAAVWFGNYEPKYSTSGYTEADLPLYDWRDDGSVFRTDKPNTFRYVSSWEDVSFEFEITSGNKIRWHIADEDIVFYNANGEKIYIDTFGVGRYEHGGKTVEVPFDYNTFLRSDSLGVEAEEDFEYLLLYTFLIDGSYRSFTCTASMTSVGIGGELTNLKEVDFVASVGEIALLIAYTDNTATVGINMSLYGVDGYWFAITGALSHPQGNSDVWLFEANGEAPEGDDDAEAIFERLGSLNFMLAEGEDGIYECFEADGILYNISCELGSLKTDCYGRATFKPAGSDEYVCTYSLQGDVLYLFWEGEDDFRDWYLIIGKDGNSFTYAGEEAGVFFSYDDHGEVDRSNLLIFNGRGEASGYYDGAWMEGNYIATGENFNFNGIALKEYKIELTYYEGTGNVTVVYALVGLVASEIHIGYVYFRDDSAVGDFTVVDEKGEAVATLRSDGYTSAVYDSENGLLLGEMHIGNSVNSARTNRYGERDFVVDVTGSSVIFFDAAGDEYLFDIVSASKIVLRTLEYGTYASYSEGNAGTGLLALDGHGGAVLTDSEGHETQAYYEAFAEIGKSFRLFNEDGETIFIFNLALVNNEEKDDDYFYGYLYVYRLYAASASGVYINEDWTILSLNGFGDARYIDKYGVETYYEAIPIDGTSVLLRAFEGGANKFVSLGDGTFEFISREFIVSEEGTLLAYNGEGGSISLPDEVLRIAAGVFNGVEISHVDFNNVEVIEENVFAGQPLDGVNAPNLRVIGGYAFARITYYNFEEVYIPNVTEIGEAAFIGCSNLELVTLGAIKFIGAQAFANVSDSYSKFIIDMSATENAAQSEIASTAFLAMDAKTFRILVKDIATVNAVIGNNSWPAKAISALSIWRSEESYPSEEYLLSLTEGARFTLFEGIITKDSGDGISVAALYEKGEDGIYVYVKQENGFATTPDISDNSGALALNIGGSIAFGNASYTGHTLTTSNGSFKFEVSIYSSSVYWGDAELTVDGKTSECSDVTYDASTGILQFSLQLDGGVSERYVVHVTSTTTCTIEKVGTQKSITTVDGNYTLVIVVDDAGAFRQLASLKMKDAWSTATIYSCEIEGDTFTVEFEASYTVRDTVKFTYHATDESITSELVKHVYVASNLYVDGLWASTSFAFDDDLKITEVLSFSISESYGGNEPQEIVNTVYNDDGTVIITLASGDRYKITVTSGYTYSASIEKVN